MRNFNLCYTLTNHKKQEHLKIHILLYFQNVYVLMTAVFTHSKIFFLFFSKMRKNTF